MILSPLPRKTIFKCNIVRKKDGLDKSFPKYYAYSFPNERFLMAARKRPKNSTPNYIITLSQETFEKDSNYLGKLRSNFFGTEFNLFDTGLNPNSTSKSIDWRCHLAGVDYETNLFGLKGPRKMRVHLSGLSEGETMREIKPNKKEDGIFEMVKKNDSRIITFRNKLPKWNESK